MRIFGLEIRSGKRHDLFMIFHNDQMKRLQALAMAVQAADRVNKNLQDALWLVQGEFHRKADGSGPEIPEDAVRRGVKTFDHSRGRVDLTASLDFECPPEIAHKMAYADHVEWHGLQWRPTSVQVNQPDGPRDMGGIRMEMEALNHRSGPRRKR